MADSAADWSALQQTSVLENEQVQLQLRRCQSEPHGVDDVQGDTDTESVVLEEDETEGVSPRQHGEGESFDWNGSVERTRSSVISQWKKTGDFKLTKEEWEEERTSTIQSMFSRKSLKVFNDKRRRKRISTIFQSLGSQEVPQPNTVENVQTSGQQEVLLSMPSDAPIRCEDTDCLSNQAGGSNFVGVVEGGGDRTEVVVAKRRPSEVQREQAAARIQALVRGVKARRAYRRMLRRGYIVRELIETEQSYVKLLKILYQWYIKPLTDGANRCVEYKEEIVSQQTIERLFSTANNIHDLHLDLLRLMQERFSHWHYHQCIGDLFVNLSSDEPLAHYTTYINNFDSATETLQTLRSDIKFKRFLDERRTFHRIREDLSDLLIAPVQRIPRYSLLLEQIIKYTPKDHPDYANLTDALKRIKHLADTMNERKRAKMEIDNLANRIVGAPVRITEEGRTLRLATDIREVHGKALKWRRLFVFSDLIMCASVVGSRNGYFDFSAKHKPVDHSKATYKCKWVLSLKEIDIRDPTHPDVAALEKALGCADAQGCMQLILWTPTGSDIYSYFVKTKEERKDLVESLRMLKREGTLSNWNRGKMSPVINKVIGKKVQRSNSQAPHMQTITKRRGKITNSPGSPTAYNMFAPVGRAPMESQLTESNQSESPLSNSSLTVDQSSPRTGHVRKGSLQMVVAGAGERGREAEGGGRNGERDEVAAKCEELARDIEVQSNILAGLLNMKKAIEDKARGGRGLEGKDKKALSELERKVEAQMAKVKELQGDLAWAQKTLTGFYSLSTK